MSTAGILRPDEVVFYHPLDNFTEHTQSQAWTGAGGFVAGKVGNANSAITGDAFAFGGGHDYLTAGAQEQAVDMLDTDKAIVAIQSTTADAGGVRVASVSGNDITYGPKSINNDMDRYVSVAALSSTTFVVAYGLASYYIDVCAGVVSGDDVTLGPNTRAGGWPDNTDTWGCDVVKLDSTHAVVAWHAEGGANPYEVRAVVATVSGLDVTTGPLSVSGDKVGTSVQMGWDMAAIDSSRVLFCFGDADDGSKGKARVVTVSGNDITWGTAHQFAASAPRHVACAMLTTTTAIVAYMASSNWAYANAGAVSGTDITWGAQAGLSGRELASYHARINASALDSTHAAVTYESTNQSPTGGMVKVATVSGLDVTFGGESTWESGWSSGMYHHSAAIGPSKVMVVYGEVSDDDSGIGKIGVLGMEAQMTASTPAAYPAATGNTRIAAAMWAKNLTAGSSKVTVQRDFIIEMTATSISLGGTTAVWDDAGISSVMTTMNDGSDHLLVLCFENTSGSDWNLNTSVDGGAFVDQGAQNSGSQVNNPASADPKLMIEDGESGQWVDELVLWSGDKAAFECFTTEELANLNDLADTFSETMDKYEENYGAPICWQATATMPDGSAWRDSGSGSCPAVIRVPKGASDVVVTDNGRPACPRIQEG